MIQMDRDRSYLLRMYEHCERIEKAKIRFGGTFEQFADDPDYRDVICMNIFQIGELANQISGETQSSLADIPWRQMYAIRNIFAHAYIKIDEKIVWDTVVNDLPKLKARLEEVIY